MFVTRTEKKQKLRKKNESGFEWPLKKTQLKKDKIKTKFKKCHK